LLNKTDLVPEHELAQLEARLRKMEPDAPLVRTRYSEVDSALVFPPDLQELRARRPPRAPAHSHESFQSTELRVEAGIPSAALAEKLRALGALRIKGFVHTSEGLRLVQGVGPRIELAEPDQPPPSELVGRLVVIQRSV